MKMNRPPHPHMMNNMYRNPVPNNHQWRNNHAQPPQFPWSNNSRNGPHDIRTEHSTEHWCETCDRGFPSVELLKKHNQQHQKCNIDGCQFVAHPKVVTKHIQMQHSTGLYKKIANLNNPEDIQKWREERRKKYPTKSNIEKKVAECKEKKERGEKMALKTDFRNNKRKSTDHGPGVKRKHNFDNRNQNHRTNRQDFNRSSSISTNKTATKPLANKTSFIPSDLKNRLKPFTGIFEIDMDDKVETTAETSDCSNGLFDDDDYEASQVIIKKSQNSQEPKVCGALTSLMCDYGTSDEETEEIRNNELNNTLSHQTPVKPHCVDHIEIENLLVKKPDLIQNGANESDDDGPEEVKIVKANVENDTTQETVIKPKEKTPAPVKRTNKLRYENKQNNYSKRRIPSTLLQKLLHKEIRQERNKVLQCIRYIIKNNYFDK